MNRRNGVNYSPSDPILRQTGFWGYKPEITESCSQPNGITSKLDKWTDAVKWLIFITHSLTIATVTQKMSGIYKHPGNLTRWPAGMFHTHEHWRAVNTALWKTSITNFIS
jgi:hypothetical protein